MREGRYDFVAGPRALRWPFALPDAPLASPVAPEFQTSLHRILRTTRFYFRLESESADRRVSASNRRYARR